MGRGLLPSPRAVAKRLPRRAVARPARRSSPVPMRSRRRPIRGRAREALSASHGAVEHRGQADPAREGHGRAALLGELPVDRPVADVQLEVQAKDVVITAHLAPAPGVGPGLRPAGRTGGRSRARPRSPRQPVSGWPGAAAIGERWVSMVMRRLAAVIDEALIDNPKITVRSAAELKSLLRDAL